MAEARVQRRLAAILAADMVGFSRLMGADEVGTIARQRALREELIDPEVVGHSGRIVKTTGDGMLVEFASVVDAVQCALAIQQGIASREPDLPDDRRICFRIGINLGDIVIDGDDILGDGVNIAARLEGLSAPGGICISDVVHQSVAGKLDLDFDDLGEQSFKNIDKPVKAFAIAPSEFGSNIPTPTQATDQQQSDGKPSVAVLPFSNMSGNPDDEYFSDGLTEDIITELSRFRELAVIARNSTFQFKGRAADVAHIGQELNARYVVEGSVRRAANRIRINAQLVEAVSGEHIWADRYDRDLDDIFAVQDELTTTIAANLGVRVQDAVLDRSLRKNPTDLNAYECVLQARRFTVLLNAEEHA
ncbi:MAG: adenylate/guanylate cyclase domain-containing protein, partial [Alphaproteobacteria bacterium]|nr:adenylate/guanylate cyclase domain-containing protein [Alphaproteobacteria bacterium]